MSGRCALTLARPLQAALGGRCLSTLHRRVAGPPPPCRPPQWSDCRRLASAARRSGGDAQAVHTAEETRAAAQAAGKTSLVIFDKDGTLICFHSMWTPWMLRTAEKIQAASGLTNVDVAQEVYKALGFCPVEQKVKPGVLAEGTNGMVRQRLVRLLVDHGVEGARADEVVEHCWESSDDLSSSEETLKALHNLHELFAELKSHDIKIAVCTADSRSGTETALRSLGLRHMIDLVVCGDDPMTEPKPSPHNALKICDALGVDPKEAYMVGDTLADVKMGRSAKLAGSVAVLSGVASRTDLEPHSDHVIDHVGKLLPIVVKKPSTSIMPKRSFSSLARLHRYSSGGVRIHKRRYSSKPPGDPNGLPPESWGKPTHIVVGAGSAGCVLASRLSEDADCKVVLVETGPRDNWWNWKIHMPAALMYNLCDDNYNWYYHTLPQRHMNERVMYWPRGRVWGGSSALNAMCYVRGHPLDYDRWHHEEGCNNWSYSHCLPYFKRTEEFRPALDGSTADDGAPYRGGDGPLKVTQGDCDNALHHAWMASGVQACYGYTHDMNGYRQEGLGRMDMTIDRGVRCSASRAYLTKEVLSRPNLYVTQRMLTTKVLFDGVRAIGIEFVRVSKGTTFDTPAERLAHSLTGVNTGNREKLYTHGEVILCGGSINTPQLMLLSGLGPGADLRRFDIDLVQDMPGVGANLQDHLEIYVQDKCVEPITLYDKSSWKFPHTMVKIGLQWFYNQTGLGATSHLESGGFIRSQPDIAHPDIQFHFLPSLVHDHGRVAPTCHGYQVHVGPMRPASTGTIKLYSTDPRHAPLIDANYMSSERDRAEFRTCVAAARELLAQPALARYSGGELAPGKQCRSDEDIDEFVRTKADSAYHPSCTCKMGPSSDSNAVVDPETLNVHGVDRLRIVDASIMPSIVSGNLNAPVIMMAEKASDVIMGRNPLPAENAPVWKPRDPKKDRENSDLDELPSRLKKMVKL